MTPNNALEPIISVFHAGLTLFSDSSPYKATCPTCETGILLVRRTENFKLSRLDMCVSCAQRFWYIDDFINHEPFEEDINDPR
jgi:uncharacterized protein with PIN domain